jgi:hypothetical protein
LENQDIDDSKKSSSDPTAVIQDKEGNKDIEPSKKEIPKGNGGFGKDFKLNGQDCRKDFECDSGCCE